MDEDEEQAELDYAGELGELIGCAVCAVIDYIGGNSQRNQDLVERSFAHLAKKLVQGGF